MYHLYIVRCVDKTLYTGITKDVKKNKIFLIILAKQPCFEQGGSDCRELLKIARTYFEQNF